MIIDWKSLDNWINLVIIKDCIRAIGIEEFRKRWND
jgi:hypothetical protein